MEWTQTARRCGARACMLGFMLLADLGAARTGVAQSAETAAQNSSRSVQGRVVDSADAPIDGAIVYLTDTRTMGVESYITQSDGEYRFEQISPGDDYKLWARSNDKKSKTKTLSSFDDRSVFHVILKIESGK